MRADIYSLSWLGVGVGLAKIQWGQEHFKVGHCHVMRDGYQFVELIKFLALTPAGVNFTLRYVSVSSVLVLITSHWSPT